MKVLFVLLLSASALNCAFGQDGYGSTSVYDRVVQLPKNKHFFIILPNQKWNETKWKDSVYRFDSFQTGKLVMSNGFVPSHRPMLNYNMILEGMDIRQPTGEIVSMRKSPTIKVIWVGDTKFIYDPTFGFLEVVLEGKISVGRKSYMKSIYELSNGNRYEDRSATDIRVSLAKATRYYWQDEQYFVLNEESKVYHAGSRVLCNLLPKKKKEIKSFVKSHKINYKKKDDILAVAAFCNQASAEQN